MCRMRARDCWGGDRTASWRNASVLPRCATTSFSSSPPTTPNPNPSNLKVFGGGGGDVVPLVSRHTTAAMSSTPYYSLNPWTLLMRRTFVGWFFTAIFCGDWLSICAGAFSESAHDPSSPWFSPSCSSPSSRTPHVLEFPRGLAQEPVLFKNRFSISGGQLPVLFFPRSL